MGKYIDADKLIAKIAELRKELPDTIEHLDDEESGFARGQQYELTAMEAEILCLLQEDEQPEYGYLSTEYIHGKKSRWNVGDVLAYYVCTSNEEGEYPLGKIINVKFDEEEGWVYTFEDESVWDEQSLVEEEAYKKN